MSKHTPGPWKAVYVGCSDWDLSGPTTREDWKLAAAAPELLVALQLMVDRFLDTEGSYGVWENEAIEAARAAIAKATGVEG